MINSINFYMTKRGGFIVKIFRVESYGKSTQVIDYGFPDTKTAKNIFIKFRFVSCKLGNKNLFTPKNSNFDKFGVKLMFRIK